MKKSFRFVGLIALCLSVGLSGGCSKQKPKPAPEVAPTPEPAATPAPATNVEPPKEEFKPLVEPKVQVTELPNAKEMGRYLKDTFFDFDKADIRTDQRDTLAANADWLRKYPGVKFRIEGHCDERGTANYNMALGERRANAVKEYLASLGVDGSRSETISYGKERPFAQGHEESAWSQNRRAHFVVTSVPK